jgi:hypothetical protein
VFIYFQAVNDGAVQTDFLEEVFRYSARYVIVWKRSSNNRTWKSAGQRGDLINTRPFLPLIIAESGILEGMSLPLNVEYSGPSRSQV